MLSRLSILPILLIIVGCSSTRPDAACLTKAANAPVTSSTNELTQRQAHLSVPVTVVEDGDAFVDANRLGVDIQGGAQAASNPVNIASLTGGNAAAAKVLTSKTPEEEAQIVRLKRLQTYLDQAGQDLSIETDPVKRSAIETRIAQLEGRESLTLARLAEIHTEKITAASGLASDMSALESIHYAIFAPQITTSHKPGTDTTWGVAGKAFEAWMTANPGGAKRETPATPDTP